MALIRILIKIANNRIFKSTNFPFKTGCRQLYDDSYLEPASSNGTGISFEGANEYFNDEAA